MSKQMTASEMGKKGGKISAERRFKGKTKKEISAKMREIRLTPKEKIEAREMAEELVSNLNKNTE